MRVFSVYNKILTKGEVHFTKEIQGVNFTPKGKLQKLSPNSSTWKFDVITKNHYYYMWDTCKTINHDKNHDLILCSFSMTTNIEWNVIFCESHFLNKQNWLNTLTRRMIKCQTNKIEQASINKISKTNNKSDYMHKNR